MFLQVRLFIQESQYLHYIPDHTLLLNEGEAFIKSCEDINVKNVVVMPDQVYFPCDLLKLRLVTYSELVKRSFQFKNKSKEYGMHSCSTLCDVKRTSSLLHYFFKELKEGYIVMSMKGEKNASFMMKNERRSHKKIWVCWGKCLVNEINEHPKVNCIEAKSVIVHTKFECSAMSQYDRFLDAWLFRNYHRDIYDLESLLNTMIDLYGFGKRSTDLVSKHIFQMVRSGLFESLLHNFEI